MQIYHLRLFGSPALELGDVVLTGRPVQRHRLALLALLALAPGRRMSRDKLIAYLWPERDTENTRNLLKVATYVLRSELGESALLSENDELRLNDQSVEADTAAFESAIAQLDYLRAVQLYRGPLLDGFFLSDSPEFEEWVAQERMRLGHAYASALENLAVAAEATQDFVGAAEWWKKRAAHDPHDTRVALRLIHALDASGSRATALQHAAIHQQLLQEEFGLDPPPEISAVMEELRQPAVGVTVSAPTSPIPTLPPALSARARTSWPRVLAAATAALALIAAVVWAAWPGAADPSPSIVVLPFVNLSNDAEAEYFSDGLTEEIIARLSSLTELKVISRTSAMHYKKSRKPLRDIARELKVAHVLEGSVRQQGGSVRVTAQLIDAERDDHIWTHNYEYELHDRFRVQERIAKDVTQALQVKLRDREAGQLVRRGTDDAEAYEHYRRARYFWATRTAEAHDQAAIYYAKALERDSNYADAYAGLANLYLTSYQLGFSKIPEVETYSRIKWAAERALSLDDTSADAHAAFAVALWWQRNWPGAERELRRALELNPGDANTRGWYVLLLGGMGRFEEALEHARRSSEGDPFALIITLNYAWVCYHMRNSRCALELHRRALELNPSWLPTYGGLGLALLQAGQVKAALDTLKHVRDLRPQSSTAAANLAYGYAVAGDRQAARQLLAGAQSNTSDAFAIARAYTALGEADSALVWLERSHWQWPHRANRFDPALDPLRADQRFQRLTLRIDRDMGIK